MHKSFVVTAASRNVTRSVPWQNEVTPVGVTQQERAARRVDDPRCLTGVCAVRPGWDG